LSSLSSPLITATMTGLRSLAGIQGLVMAELFVVPSLFRWVWPSVHSLAVGGRHCQLVMAPSSCPSRRSSQSSSSP
jgi:hypothetical protein